MNEHTEAAGAVKPKRKTKTSAAVKNRYAVNHYSKYSLFLRKDDDADIIADIEAARAAGLSLRDYVRKLYEAAKEA